MKLIRISTDNEVTTLFKGTKQKCQSALSSYYKVFEENNSNIVEGYNQAMQKGMFELLYSDGEPMYKYIIVRER